MGSMRWSTRSMAQRKSRHPRATACKDDETLPDQPFSLQTVIDMLSSHNDSNRLRKRVLRKRVTRPALFHRERRRGVAAVEFAVCLPMLVLLVFGSIEASSIIFLKQTLNVSAYEATREAIRDGRNNADARLRAENILNARNINGFAISFPRGESADADRGDEVVVTVTAPTAPNSPLLGQFISDRVLTSRVVMVKQ